MSDFSIVNTKITADSMKSGSDLNTPTTPRPSTAPSAELMARDDTVTPTRATFSSLAEQRPLPSSPFPALNETPAQAEASEQSLRRGNSQYSNTSLDSEDVNMDGEDDAGAESDDESVNADGTRSSKKKKSQRFHCRDYFPCTLSFTRSEHLARHIRKHTGERPFVCHCNRRFSRLDNLRQHAQTVHVNEDIPHDSLAATGTRFQRQVRTERVRPPGGRSRATAAASPGLQLRGHQRGSLSLSSVGSVSSVFSPRERDGGRPRPPPLVMSGEPRNRYSQEIHRTESPTEAYRHEYGAPSGFSTPTSATFSTGQNSPYWGSALQSPVISHSRTSSSYGELRTPGRRLSVPSTGNPFQSPNSNYFGTPLLGQMSPSASGPFSPASGQFPSPTTSTMGSWSRRESVSSIAEDPRRRTWHPDTSNFVSFTSRLQNVTSANYPSTRPPPPPSQLVPSNAPPPSEQNSMRLPGIASFDPLPRAATPVQRQHSPMNIDAHPQVPQQHQVAERFQEQPPVRVSQQYSTEQFRDRPNSSQWETGINRNLSNLNINPNPSYTDASSWATEANRAVQAQAERSRAQLGATRFEESQYSSRTIPTQAYHQHTNSAPPITPKSAKRQGWYNGPISPTSDAVRAHDPRFPRTSPEGSSSSEGGIPVTPRTVNAADTQTRIVHSNGLVEITGRHELTHEQRAAPPPSYQTFQASHNYTPAPVQYSSLPPHIQQVHLPDHIQRTTPKPGDDNMLRLDALVAVATSRNSSGAY